MREKKQNVKLILSIITFTVLLIYLINNTQLIISFVKRFIEVLFPFLLGCGIAFIINIPMRGIENKFFSNEDGRLYKARRVISMLVSYVLAICVVLLVIFVVVPEVADTIAKIKDKLPGFAESAKNWILKYTERYPDVTEAIMSINIDWNGIGNIFKDNSSTIITTTVNIFSSIIGTIINIFVGLIFSLYILAQKEKLGRQTKLVCYALFKESTADELMVFGKIVNTAFSKFFTCQFREGGILGAMFVVMMSILQLPYALTIGLLIAFTALIPVFGAFIGLFIGAFLILVESPSLVLWFVVLFFVLQFIENYLIYPRLVGEDVGLSAIWVLLAVIVGGELMGVAGMFLFIPLISVIYAYFRSIVYRKLKRRDIDVDDKQVPDEVMPLMEGRRRLFRPKNKSVPDDESEDAEKSENAEDNEPKDKE